MSSPTNSRMTAPSLREQQLEDRVRVLEARLQQRHDSPKEAAPGSPTSSVDSSRSLKKSEFETIIAQQMQMIASLAASSQSANERMEKQMDLITNLQHTVADLVIRVNDRDSDASTNTSNEQRKRRIPHPTAKTSMRRLHPNDAGTTGPNNAPPDPGALYRYVEFPALTSQVEDIAVQQAALHGIQDDTAVTQVENPTSEDHMDENSTDEAPDENMAPPSNEIDNHASHLQDVNGGIDDNDLINMMAQDAQSLHTPILNDHEPSGPCGSNEKTC